MPDVPGLTALARLYNVQTSFFDTAGRRRIASAEALAATLRALGAPLSSLDDVPGALRQRRRELWARPLEPVTVSWRGRPSSATVRLPTDYSARAVTCELTPEDGGGRRRVLRLNTRRAQESAEVDGARFDVYRLPLPVDLPMGYHRLRIEMGGEGTESLVIVAPSKAYRRPGEGRSWGVFLPLYALRSGDDWGAGDFGGLRSLMAWAAELDGGTVATLPLLAAFLDKPFEPSPYVPASRLFWNESHLDIESIPELADCEAARGLVTSPQLRREAKRLRERPLVDHQGLARLKRGVLERLSRCFFDGRSARRGEFQRFLETRPETNDYARFRAAGERLGVPWHDWPAPLRDGVLGPGDCDRDAERYHLYVQWLAEEQVAGIARAARGSRVGLYLDMPLGSHPDGYDTWRERELFAPTASVGAPPDTFFPGGQDWGFRAPNPRAQREQGYSHFRACLRHHLRHASTLRIDHVMGLHRLYWIPRQSGSGEGVYVRYPHEELYAILCLESHRYRAAIVGEDLGTVPHKVRRAMGEHGLTRSYVMQIEPTASSSRPFGLIPRESVASLGTHDTPTFAAFWRGRDTEIKQGLGVISSAAAAGERRSRERQRKAIVRFLRQRRLIPHSPPDEAAVLRACLAYLSASRARTLLVALEDLWLEVESQNIPGTRDEHPNWQRKARYTLEELRNAPEVVGILRDLNAQRKGTAYRAPRR